MKKTIRKAVILIAVLCILCLSGCGRAERYAQAVSALEAGSYAAAAESFEALGDYKDSAARAESARQLAAKQSDYEKALALAEDGEYDEAARLFEALSDYENSAELSLDCRYKAAEALAEAGQWSLAAESFEALTDYADSAERAEVCRAEAVKAAYENAVALFEAGEYEQAETLFASVPDYGEAELYLKAVGIALCEVGDTVSFGSYIQEGDAPSPIVWQVLAAEEGRFLLLSRDGLECMRFHKALYPFWANSEMRRWLEDSFLPAAFTEDEQRLIELSANSTPGYFSNLGLYMGGPDTEDRVFLLSKEELAQYLPEEGDGLCKPTAFALAAGAQTDDEGNCPWWTRSPGDHHGQICVVQADGGQNAYYSVGWDNICIRPAVWVNIHVQQE